METYVKQNLEVQTYFYPATSKGFSFKMVGRKKTLAYTIPYQKWKLPHNFAYYVLEKVSPGKFKAVNKKTGKTVMTLNMTVSPAVIQFSPPRGFELTCAGAWAWANFMMAIVEFDADVVDEWAVGACLGVPACVLSDWAGTQMWVQQEDNYFENWAENYCSQHGGHDIGPDDDSGCGDGGADGYYGPSSGGSFGSSGSGGSGGFTSGSFGSGGGTSSGGGSCGSNECTNSRIFPGGVHRQHVPR